MLNSKRLYVNIGSFKVFEMEKQVRLYIAQAGIWSQKLDRMIWVTPDNPEAICLEEKEARKVAENTYNTNKTRVISWNGSPLELPNVRNVDLWVKGVKSSIEHAKRKILRGGSEAVLGSKMLLKRQEQLEKVIKQL